MNNKGSTNRPLLTSHLGLSGPKNTKTIWNSAGIACTAEGTRHAQELWIRNDPNVFETSVFDNVLSLKNLNFTVQAALQARMSSEKTLCSQKKTYNTAPPCLRKNEGYSQMHVYIVADCSPKSTKHGG